MLQLKKKETSQKENMTIQIQSTTSGGKMVFVTVGTTRFDKLVSAATSTMALEWMTAQGYDTLVVQYGTGLEPQIPEQYTAATARLSIQTYRFQPSLEKDMQRADLILSHAGAGTVMEALRMEKTLIVVINTDLMDNHQTELATAMAERGHLFVVETPEHLLDQPATTWHAFQEFVPRFPQLQQQQQKGEAEMDFPRLVDAFLGFSTPDSTTEQTGERKKKL
jgi:beta-1,4-N-acetylglucosaminyltransferase